MKVDLKSYLPCDITILTANANGTFSAVNKKGQYNVRKNRFDLNTALKDVKQTNKFSIVPIDEEYNANWTITNGSYIVFGKIDEGIYTPLKNVPSGQFSLSVALDEEHFKVSNVFERRIGFWFPAGEVYCEGSE